jgi:hypothetical protein
MSHLRITRLIRYEATLSERCWMQDDKRAFIVILPFSLAQEGSGGR